MACNSLAGMQFRPPRGFVHDDHDRFRQVDDDLVEYDNGRGDTFYFRTQELKEVLLEGVQNVIQEKNINLYKEVEDKMQAFATKYIDDMEKDFLNIFYNKVDEIAEKLAVKMLNYKIEEEVEKRLEEKLEEMKQILNKKT